MKTRLVRLAVLAGVLAACWGCTAESVRVALAAQQRADDVQQAVFEQQQAALRVLLYRDLVARLRVADGGVNEAEAAALNDVWNERDLLAFWAVQHERARALRIASVDAKLFAGQSVVDLLVKQLDVRTQRAEAGVASAVGAALSASQTQESEVQP